MFTYQKAKEILGNYMQKKVANNTYLINFNNRIGVKLHDTVIVLLHEDGTVQFNSGTWQTKTTKDRINRFSPIQY